MYVGSEHAQERMLTGLTKAEKQAFIETLNRIVDADNEVSRVPVSAP